jgi:Ca2+-binding EF-hand superfamily protein
MSRTSKTQPAQPVKPQPAPQLSWKDRLTPEDYEDLKNTFEVFDEDGSGTIDPAEINKVLEELGLDKRNPFILSLIHGLRDKNKPINFNEFLEVVVGRVGETKTKEGLKRVFSLYDKDENGVIDFEEFKTVSRQLHENLNDDDLREMLHSASINNKTSSNEGFTFEEFYTIVSKFVNR